MKQPVSPTEARQTTYLFGDVRLERQNFCLLKSGHPVAIEPRAFEVLLLLIDHRDRVVEKQELFDEIWKQSFVTDSALAQEIKNIRRIIGDDAHSPRYVQTVHKRGYRFIGPIEEVSSRKEPGKSGSARARLVVLPFVSLDSDSEKEYLSDAFTEEFITELASLAPEDLLVIARTTAMHYKRTNMHVGQICTELNVNYLVEGSVRHENGHIAITLQLIRANDQMHLMSRRYSADIRDPFRILHRMAESVAAEIGITGFDDEDHTRVKRKPTTDPVAYDLYLRARRLDRTPENIAKAKKYYEQAITRDSNFALAYDGLADLYWYLGFAGVAPAKELSTAGVFHCLRALELDNQLAETHALLAMYRKELDYDWAEVKREMDIALSLDPLSPLVRFRYAASWLLPQGRLEEAAREIEKTLESDPLSSFYRSWLAVILWLDRKYDRAIEQARMIVTYEPHVYTGHWILGMTYRDYGKFEDAIASGRKAVELSRGLPLLVGWLGLALGQGGEAAEARAVLEQLRQFAKKSYVPPSSFGWTYFGLGEIDEAFIWFDRAVEGRDHMMIPIKSYPFFDTIREDTRYLSLLQKMNLDAEPTGIDCRTKR